MTCTHVGTHNHNVRVTHEHDTVLLELTIFPVEPVLPSRDESAHMTGADWAKAMEAQRVTIASVRVPLADAYWIHNGQQFQTATLTGAAERLAREHAGGQADIEWLGRGWNVWLY